LSYNYDLKHAVSQSTALPHDKFDKDYLKKPSSSKMETQQRGGEDYGESWNRCYAVEKAKPEDERRPAPERFQCGESHRRAVDEQRRRSSGPLKPSKVEYAGPRMYTTQSSPITTTVNSPVGASTTTEKGNIVNDSANRHAMPINAELTAYFRKVPLPYDRDKEEAAMLLANATTKAQWKWKGKSKWRGESGGEVTVEELAL
ncbi:hypothetical protein PQX77_018955, partial [Marasmius sp. AFHP31]